MADGKNDVVLSFNDSLVRQSDVQLLDGPHWLNDIVIGFCFEYVNYYLLYKCFWKC
jgi:sentrin-specific protease 8